MALDPNAIITSRYKNIYGTSLRMSRRTEAHLAYTEEKLPPGKYIRIIQGPYNRTVSVSAGTHDYDAVLDVEIVGMSYPDAQTFLRKCGWAAWYRTPSQGFDPHIHMISLGYKTQVGQWVPGQVADYYNHEDGLAGGGYDPSWFPKDIRATIFDYAAWTKEAEDLKLSDDIYPDKRDVTVGNVLRRLDTFMERSTAREVAMREKLGRVASAVDRLPDGVTKREVSDLLRALELELTAPEGSEG